MMNFMTYRGMVAWTIPLSVILILATAAQARAAADPLDDETSWTLAILPDTQHYADNPNNSSNFTAQTQWIKNHADSHNIAFVLQEGDLINDNDASPSDPSNQWQRARAAMDILHDANPALSVPYAIAPGNHDFGPSGNGGTRDSEFSDTDKFGPGTPYATQPTVGGFYESGRTENSYHTFNAGGQDWLVLALEFGPRDPVIDWANQVVNDHPSHQVILVTHAYLYLDDTRLDWKLHGDGTSQGAKNPHHYGVAALPGGVNDGQEMWDKLVGQHENFRFAFSGHIGSDGTGHLMSMGTNGNLVDQVLANYQFLPSGGQGYMRLLEFKADGSIQVRTYSPSLDLHDRDPDQEFLITSLNGVEGDLDQSGSLDLVDYELFLANWRSDTFGMTAIERYKHGDLDLNGVTEIRDAFLMDRAMSAQGLTFSFEDLKAVPEPSSSILVFFVLVSVSRSRGLLRLAGGNNN